MASEVQTGQLLPRLDPATHLAVTNGLIRWWPNLFDVRDEVTGEEGVVMGVLPPVETGAEDETDFGRSTGWVQLQPAITNEVFTLSVWVRFLRAAPHAWQWLVGQESRDVEWYLQTDRTLTGLVIGSCEWDRTNATERACVTPEQWHHIAVTRRADGTSQIRVDGILQFDGRLAHPWPGKSRWLAVGNLPRGGEQDFHGSARDLCVFDRVLSEVELRALHAGGVPRRPARNTDARLAATARLVAVEVSTNLVHRPPRTWAQRRYLSEDGLPGNMVTAVLQGHDGHLWVGTEDGLAEFDGRGFRTFTKENTPALAAIGHRVCSLAEDEAHAIWAGIIGGLLRIQAGHFTAFTNGLPQRYVLQATPAGAGWLWIAGFMTDQRRGPCWLRRYHPDSGTTSGETIVPGHPRRLVPASNGVWLATEQPQQMLFWDGHAAAARVLGTVESATPVVRLNAGIRSGHASVHLWEERGKETNQWAEVRLGEGLPIFHWLWHPRWGRPFLCRWNGSETGPDWLGVTFGRARRRGDGLEVIEVDKESARQEVACACPNREGGVWFGTEGDGLHLVREKLVTVFTPEDGLSADDVRSVCTSPSGDVWVTTGSGLNRWREGRWTTQEPLGRFRAIACDRRGEPWYGRAQSSPEGLSTTFLPPMGIGVLQELDWRHPNSLRFARDGTFWVACENGVTWLKPDRMRLDARGLLSPDPASPEPAFGRYAVGQQFPTNMFPLGLVEDRGGSIWVGSLRHGLYRLDPDGVKAFGRQDGLPADHCVPVHVDEENGLWILAEGRLVRRRDGQFRSIDVHAGLPQDTLLDLIPDDLGNFWISGKRGIHRVARRALNDFCDGRRERVHSLTLGVEDGLLTPECSSQHYPSLAKTPDGHIWVATHRGLARFDPRRVEREVKPLIVKIDRVVANQRDLAVVPLSAGARCDVRPGADGQVVVHFNAQTLLHADRVRFRHRLGGHDARWSEGDLPLAFYANLRSGDYEFQVQAADRHGLWSEEASLLRLRILPYFWRTRSFQIEAGVLAIVFAAILLWRRMISQRRIQELRHGRAMANEKARIAADLHDELGAALTQITILGEVGEGQAGETARTRSTLATIAQTAREATTRMSELVWATNPRHDTLDNLVAFLRQHAASRLESAGLDARLEFPEEVPARQVSATFRRNLLLVLKEALTNITKHAAAGAVRVQIDLSPTALELRVQDDGRGFDPAARAGAGNGTRNMEQRVRDLGGTFSLRSVPGHGTSLEIRVPFIEPK